MRVASGDREHVDVDTWERWYLEKDENRLLGIARRAVCEFKSHLS